MERFKPPPPEPTPTPLPCREEFVRVLLFTNALRFHAGEMKPEVLEQIRGGADSLRRADPISDIEFKTMMTVPEEIFKRIFDRTMEKVREAKR